MTAFLFLASMVISIILVVLAVLDRFGKVRLWPAVLLIACAPLEVYRAEVGFFNLSVFRMALLIAVAAFVWDVVRRPPRRLAIPAIVAMYAGLIVLQVLSIVAVTDARSLGTRFLLQYVGGIASALVVVRFVRRRDLPATAIAYVCAALLPALASVWRILAPGPAGGSRTLPGLDLLPVDPTIAAAREQGSFLLEGVQRMQGTYADPNHFAFFVATVLIVIAGLLVRQWHSGFGIADQHSKVLWLAGAVCAALLVGTYSRSAWLLATVGMLLAAALAGRTALRAFVTRRRLVVALVAAALCGLLAAPAVVSRLDPATSGSSRSTNEHLDTMRLAVELFAQRPVTGTGIGGYGRFADQPALLSSAHSTLLTTAAELGAPGALLLLSIFVGTAFWGRRTTASIAEPRSRAVPAALLGAWLAMAASNLLYEVWVDDFQWMLFALVLVGTRQPSLRLTPSRMSFGVRGRGDLRVGT